MTTPEFLDEQAAMYAMLTLTKARVRQNLSRTEVARRMGVDIQRIHDFDERKTPWRSVSYSFIRKYARAVGLEAHIGYTEAPWEG